MAKWRNMLGLLVFWVISGFMAFIGYNLGWLNIWWAIAFGLVIMPGAILSVIAIYILFTTNWSGV